MSDKRLQLAREYLDSEPDVTMGLCLEMLRDDPNNAQALFLTGVLQVRSASQIASAETASASAITQPPPPAPVSFAPNAPASRAL
jgi:hypothetical protein